MLLLLGLLGIAVVDGLNPSIILMTRLLLGTPEPAARTATYIAAVFLTNWALGLAAYFGLGVGISRALEVVLDASSWWVYALEGLAGVALLVAAWWLGRRPTRREVKQPRRIDPRATFALGVGATVVEFATAAPYLAGIAALTRAEPSPLYAVTALALYNVVYIGIPLALYAVRFARADAAALLQRLGERLTELIRKSLRVLFLLLALGLLADFVAYLVGDPFFGDA